MSNDIAVLKQAVSVNHYGQLVQAFFYGLLLPLSFAPFHLPGAAILSLALLYLQLNKTSNGRLAFFKGLFYGLGFFGLGTSWVFVSIHEYGQLNEFSSAFVTLIFLVYLSLFTAIMSMIYNKISTKKNNLYSSLVFSSLWILFEYLRSTLFSGFPWLQLGFGQFDAPCKYLLPLVGVYGVGFISCLAATFLATSLFSKGKKKLLFLGSGIALIISPLLLKNHSWAQESASPITVGVIQANLSMRDKWDEHLFWQLLSHYKKETEKLLGTKLIVMPESAIPLPPNYVVEFLSEMDQRAKKAGSAVMLGIPTPTLSDENYYHNALISLGSAKGSYQKKHLVPFGEYIPAFLRVISTWLAIPDANLKPGNNKQPLLKVHHHAIATLICYELAYSELLRQQLPSAEWIVSISDSGWFGHSLAMYQQLQMAQVRSVQTARYQVVANNDGLSSVINAQGEIKSSLPAFSAGILKGELIPASGLTPWVYFGNSPILLFCLLIVLFYTASVKMRKIS